MSGESYSLIGKNVIYEKLWKVAIKIAKVVNNNSAVFQLSSGELMESWKTSWKDIFPAYW